MDKQRTIPPHVATWLALAAIALMSVGIGVYLALSECPPAFDSTVSIPMAPEKARD